MPAAAAIVGGTAVLGAVAGSQKDRTKSEVDSTVHVGTETPLEAMGFNQVAAGARGFSDMINQGAGSEDVAHGAQASRDLAALLGEYGKNGAIPTASDISRSNQYASDIFNPQRVAMGQAFDDQLTAANRQAALMGRDLNDPILRAKLAQEQTRQGALLQAQQGSFAAQFAQQQPFQRLGFMGQQADVLQGLASQALANRQALVSMGQGIQNNDRNYRLAAAGRTTTQNTESGGGLKGAILGGMAGAGAGMSMMGGQAPNMQGFQTQPQGVPYNYSQPSYAQPGSLSGYNYQQNPNSFFGSGGGSPFSGAGG